MNGRRSELKNEIADSPYLVTLTIVEFFSYDSMTRKPLLYIFSRCVMNESNVVIWSLTTNSFLYILARNSVYSQSLYNAIPCYPLRAIPNAVSEQAMYASLMKI
jgi:hypothetical protein